MQSSDFDSPLHVRATWPPVLGPVYHYLVMLPWQTARHLLELLFYCSAHKWQEQGEFATHTEYWATDSPVSIVWYLSSPPVLTKRIHALWPVSSLQNERPAKKTSMNTNGGGWKKTFVQLIKGKYALIPTLPRPAPPHPPFHQGRLFFPPSRAPSFSSVGNK